MTQPFLVTVIAGNLLALLIVGLTLCAAGVAGVSVALSFKGRALQRMKAALADTQAKAASAEANVLGLLERWPDSVFLLEQGRARYVNEAGAKLLGFEHMDQARGLRLEDHLHPDEVAAERERMKLALQG